MSTPARMKNDVKAPTQSPDNGMEEDEHGDATNNSTKIRKRRLDVNPNLIISDGRSKRRKSPTPDAHAGGAGGGKGEDQEGAYDPKDPDRAQQLGYMIYGKVMGMKSSDGESLSEPFIELPNKKAFPDYYETIKVPMSLNMVKAKLDAKGYENLRGVERDLGQIFNNAKRYNVKESAIFQYAKKLHKMVRTFYNQHTQPGKAAAPDSDDEDQKPSVRNTQPPSSSLPPVPLPTTVDAQHDDEDDGRGGSMEADGSGRYKKRGSYMREGPTVYKLVKPILKAIKEATARDGSGREIAGIFMELPDRREFADYYKTIQHPISLKEIEDRMIARSYNTWQEFFDDVNLMVRNAQTYNEDESEVFKDAAQIAEILEAHRPSIHDKLSKPPVDRSRPKPMLGTPQPAQAYGQRPGYMPTPSPATYSQSPQVTSLSTGINSYPGIPPTPPARPSSSLNPPTAVDGGFLPALPKGVVTADIVASLDRYPQYEQAAWASSLPPVGMQVYRQYLASNEAKKRGLVNTVTPSPWQNMPNTAVNVGQSSTAPTMSDLPSSARANGSSNLPDRLAPPLPTIKYLDFAFSSGGSANRSSAIRLHNMRGVVTHAVVLASDTTELELTAYIADPPKPSETTPASEGMDSIPEVSLRVNGNVGSLPRFVHLNEGDDTSVGGVPTQPDATTPAIPGKRPSGMRWTISVPPSRTETKIEVVATKPGSLAETSAIYVSRQY